MEFQTSRKNFKQLYRDQASRFYNQLLHILVAEAEALEETRKKESAVEKDLIRNTNASSRFTAISSSLTKTSEETTKLEQMKQDLTTQLSCEVKKVENLTTRLADINFKIDKQNEESMKTKDKVCKAIQPYQEYLGLTFEKAKDGTLRFIFKLPSQKLCVVKFVKESDKFKIIQCKPSLRDLDQLEAKFHKTKNFGAFITDLYYAFQK